MALPLPTGGSRAHVPRVVLASTALVAALGLASCAGTSPGDNASAGYGELRGGLQVSSSEYGRLTAQT